MCCSVYGSNDVAGRRGGEALLLFFGVVNSFGKSRGLLAAVTLLFIPALKRRCREKIDRIRGPSTLIHNFYLWTKTFQPIPLRWVSRPL